MKTYKTLSIGIILLTIIVMNFGCQPSQAQSATDEQKLDTAPSAPKAVRPEVSKTKPVKSTGAAEQKTATPKPVPVTTEKGEDSQGNPVIEVKNIVHDFGMVGPASANTCEFTFTNTGDATLKIQRIQSTCGCTVPELEKKEYAPGESGTIKVAFKAPSTKGNVSKHLYIISNDPKTPRAELEIKCQVVVKVSVTPENVELRFDQDNAGMGDLVVKSIDEVEFSIKTVTIGHEVMKVDFKPAEKAKEFTLKPQVDMEKLNKYPTGVVQIKTDHPQSGMLMVRYTAKPRYEVSRPRIILQNVEPGKVVEKDVVIRSNYETPVEIASIESRNGYMEISSQEKDGNGIKLNILITPPEKGATARRYITDELTIHLKDETKLSIRCSGWFRLQ